MLADADGATRGAEARLQEAVGLALAIRLDVIHSEVVHLAQIRPATFIGKGIVERLGELIVALEIGVVIVDATLAPVQQRNLERAWNAQVIDRTGLILDIFGDRARTYEGRAQVERAALSYTRSRLQSEDRRLGQE